MSFTEILRLAFQNIRSNWLRSVLTLFIIALGIMALVGILTSIDTIATSLNDNFSGLGANSFTIERKWQEIKSRRRGRSQKVGRPISYADAKNFKERFHFPARVSISLHATNFATVSCGDKKSNPNVGLVGIDENYLDLKGLEIEQGRNFSINEVEDGALRAVVGREIVQKLFDGTTAKALDQVLTVNNHRFRIIGVLQSKGASMGNTEDRAVYVPILNIKNWYGGSETNYQLLIGVKNATDLDAAVAEATGVFRQVRRLRPEEEEDFEIFKSNSLAEILKENTLTLQIATIAIGLMTLLGAAIGLMNIMLVSVTERTREIGIYKALGATQRNILMQFLTEAVILCQMGGIVGIGLGILAGNAVSLMMGGKFLIPWAWILLGFSLCMLVGIVSGFYPAMRAARLDPIEALRYE